ncbi:hypothetical protein Tco_1341095, partial [Tanacetum coccineum]
MDPSQSWAARWLNKQQTVSGRADDDEEMAPKVEQSEGMKDKKKPIISFCIEVLSLDFGTWEVEDTNLNQ